MPIDAPHDAGSPSTTGKQLAGSKRESPTIAELAAAASTAATETATAAAAAAAAVRAIESLLADHTEDLARAASLHDGADSDIPDLTAYDDDPLKKAIEVERYRLDIADAMLGCLHAFFEADLNFKAYQLAPPDPAFVIVAVRKHLKKSISGLDSNALNRLIDAARTNANPSRPSAEAPAGQSDE